MGFPAPVLGVLRRGLRGKWRILGVGGGGGYCHFGLLEAAMAPIVIDISKSVFLLGIVIKHQNLN